MQGKSVVYTNGAGLRCARTGAGWMPGATDLLILGDSLMFGWGLPFEATVPGQLNALYERDGRSVQNAAVQGHYLKNQIELLHSLYDSGVRPREVLVVLTPHNLVMASSYAHAKVAPDGRLVDGFTETHRYLKLTNWLKTHPVLYARVRDAIVAAVPERDSESAEPAAVKPFRRDLQGQNEATALAELTALRDWAASKGIRLSIAYAPRATEYKFGSIEEEARKSGAAIGRSIPAQQAADIGRALGVRFIDLRPAVAAVVAGGDSASLGLGDAHYDAAASAACARALFASLSRP